MNIVYNKNTGKIISAISVDQEPSTYYQYFNEDFKKNLDWFKLEKVPYPLEDYYVDLNTKELKKHSQEEIEEKSIYGKILTEEERQLNKLKPSYGEVKKAENTIEILSLIQEVM